MNVSNFGHPLFPRRDSFEFFTLAKPILANVSSFVCPRHECFEFLAFAMPIPANVSSVAIM